MARLLFLTSNLLLPSTVYKHQIRFISESERERALDILAEKETEKDREKQRQKETEKEGGGERDTDTDDLSIYAIAPHEGMRVDDQPPHSTYYNCAYEQENQQTNDDVLDSVLTMTV